MTEKDLAARIATFLASDPIGVVGASKDTAKYGHIVLRSLLGSDRRAIPVNPRADEILGITAVRSVRDLPEETVALSVITPPMVTERVVGEAIERGIEQIWLQPGAESDAAIAAAEAAGIAVIADGSCILVALAREKQ